MSNMYTKCIFLMFLGVCFKKMCSFVNLLLKLNLYVLSSRFKEFKYQKMIYHHLKKNLTKKYFVCLCMEVLL